MRMIQGSDGPRLALESLNELLGDDLDGDRPAQARIRAAVDLSR